MRTIRAIGIGAFLGTAALCGLDACSTSDRPTGPAPRRVARIIIQPGHDTIGLGQSLQYVAVAVDGSGQPMPGVGFVWSSAHPRVAPIVAGTPSDSARSTGDSVGVTKIVALADGVISDSATLVVMPSTGTDTDTSGTLIACNGVHQLVHGWIVDVTFSYSFSGGGLDAHTDAQASYSIQDHGEVVLKLARKDTLPADVVNYTLWTDDHTPAAADGSVSMQDKEVQMYASGNTVLTRSTSGKPMVNPVVNTGTFLLDTAGGDCRYMFALSATIPDTLTASSSDGIETTAGTVGAAAITSAFLPVSQGEANTPELTLSGSAGFKVGFGIDPDPFAEGNTLPGWYQIPIWPANDILMSGLATNDQFGTAKVSWRITAIP